MRFALFLSFAIAVATAQAALADFCTSAQDCSSCQVCRARSPYDDLALLYGRFRSLFLVLGEKSGKVASLFQTSLSVATLAWQIEY